MKNFVFVFFLLTGIQARAQIRFSIATDLSVMRNFSPQQKFWALGQTVQGNFHFNKKETAYAWLSYYSKGKFKNDFTATAKSSVTIPQLIRYRVSGTWRYREVSMGWKHYFKGAFDNERWNLYSIAGFGLMFTKAENIFSWSVDTALYNLPPAPVSGINSFYRLTIDLGMGTEFPIGGNFFLYSDIRTWLPTSDYPSPYLHNNKNVPLPIMISAGMRILFGGSY